MNKVRIGKKDKKSAGKMNESVQHKKSKTAIATYRYVASYETLWAYSAAPETTQTESKDFLLKVRKVRAHPFYFGRAKSMDGRTILQRGEGLYMMCNKLGLQRVKEK